MNATPDPDVGTLGERTLNLLWERVRQQGDMPGFTKAIGAILGAMRGEEEPAFDMTQTVLSDPVLMQKVLRLANSGMYAAFGQSVSSVSKAVLVLGTDTIGHLALGLKLIEELSGASPEPGVAHVEMEKAVLAGMVAQQVAADADNAHAEEAVVCAILHALGRMMLTFYLDGHWQALQRHAGPGREAQAAPQVLGLSLEAIGRATAQQWGLPPNLISGMRHLAPPETGVPVGHADWIAGLATMSALCADALWQDDEAGAAEVLLIAGRYAGMLGVSCDALAESIEKAKAVAVQDLSIAPLSRPAERRARTLASTRQRAAGKQILVQGVAGMRAALRSAGPSQMVAMALEAVHRGLDLSRAVAFVRSHKEHKYAAKMSRGGGVEPLLAQMTFDDRYEANVFHAALNSERVIFIENAKDPKFAAKLPQWWKDTLPDARSFVILPLSANGQPTGFIYGDWDDSFPPIQLSGAEFALLNDMRALFAQSVDLRARPQQVANGAG